MKTQSVWEDTKTFFPLFLREIDRARVETVCVAGASDGKFVIPLAERGLNVVAIEQDAAAINGGPVIFPGRVPGRMEGLMSRLESEGLSRLVVVVEANLLDDSLELGSYGAVWTSCSWHYSMNHHRSLTEFIGKLKDLCEPGGLLGAEYFLASEPRHQGKEHYLSEGEIRHYFHGWEVHWDAYTPPFVESPHVEQLQEHIHRMGFVVMQKPRL